MNHLQGQTSPYLLQHVGNPVDWYPWGEEALSRARSEGKPIFLSIGYAACHWCHVMERESFENESTAKLLNDSFVSIKVDREERPDLDEIYMTAVQMMTGQGGWPLNMFLTPEGKPFYGGTYFPPDDRYGRASFPRVLGAIKDAWENRRDEIETSAVGMAARIVEVSEAAAPASGATVGATESALAAADLAARFDPTWGGFGQAPKFPPHGALGLLLREHARTGEPVPRRMATLTLDKMAMGGMYDQVGGGFARYSVDERWLVPHFEKMLYDQALLVPVYVDAWLATGSPLYRAVVLETLDFVRRELTDAAGGFHSSLDADSEGHEGKFYVWTPAEIEAVLGPDDAGEFCAAYDVTLAGNFEGKNIPNLSDATVSERERFRPMREKLLAARASRVRPGTDDKVLASWNGLAITAFARAHQAFSRPEDLESARRGADFLLGTMRYHGRLLAAYRGGVARLNAYLDDYAFVARGLLDLYETTFEERYLDAAVELARVAIERFAGPDGAWYFTSDDHEALIARTKSRWDGALPAGAGVIAETLFRLALHTGDDALSSAAERTLADLAPIVKRQPSAFASALTASAYAGLAPLEVKIAGRPEDPRAKELLAVVRSAYLPARSIAWQREERASVLLCHGGACDAPVTSPAALARVLASPARRTA
ncbi:MAG TPA: thioredoxin domain-containing protein [Candidatus Polarisedimenticolaceae bacterium]|nr:thioredoxin domain-containing protein [Candidatus Polarisedimenticolaceae bacterium]